jgi:hypothetical protein
MNGLAKYRQEYIRTYKTDAPLQDVMRTVGGDYARYNLDAMVARCSGMIDQAMKASK